MKKLVNNQKIGELDSVALSILLEEFSNDLEVKKWDMGASSSRDISVQVQNGKAKQLKGSQRNSMTLRVWNNNKVGITSTSDLTNEGIKKAMRGAIAASDYGNDPECFAANIALKSATRNNINSQLEKLRELSLNPADTSF